MARTFGAIDKVLSRKRRSDAGKKRKKYAGEPCKHRKPNYYTRRIGNKKTIKIRPIYRVPMSKDGYHNWKPNLRPKVWKEVSNMKLSPVMEVSLDQINTKKKIEEFIAMNKWKGKFVIMGISNAKTKTHRKWVKICTILVKETPNGNVGRMVENVRLSKYSWFYRN